MGCSTSWPRDEKHPLNTWVVSARANCRGQGAAGKQGGFPTRNKQTTTIKAGELPGGGGARRRALPLLPHSSRLQRNWLEWWGNEQKTDRQTHRNTKTHRKNCWTQANCTADGKTWKLGVLWMLRIEQGAGLLGTAGQGGGVIIDRKMRRVCGVQLD